MQQASKHATSKQFSSTQPKTQFQVCHRKNKVFSWVQFIQQKKILSRIYRQLDHKAGRKQYKAGKQLRGISDKFTRNVKAVIQSVFVSINPSAWQIPTWWSLLVSLWRNDPDRDRRRATQTPTRLQPQGSDTKPQTKSIFILFCFQPC